MPQNVPEEDPTLVLANLRKEWVLSSVVNRVPFSKARSRLYARLGGVQFEAVEDTLLLRGVEILEPQRLQLGRGTVINRGVLLDARGFLEIGRDVGIDERAVVLTGAHGFEGGVTDHIWRTRVQDKAFIGHGAMIMGGVTIGEGAVVEPGALVTRDVEPWTVVGGTPAKKVDERQPCDYTLYRRGDPGASRVNWR